MSNPDKHKPLSAEELFKLLGNASDKANDFDELDDFEKEALEGFSSHSDAQKAKALTDELNIAISNKVTDSQKGGSRNKFIWFSAAASIVLVIMLSIFFFNQTKEDSATNIALKESTEDKAPAPVEPGSGVMQINEETKSIPDAKDVVQANGPVQKISLNDQEVGFSKNAEGERLAGGISSVETTVPAAEYRAENKPNLALAEKSAKDESKNRNEYDVDDLKKQGDLVLDNLETKKKEKITLAQEQAREETMELQSINTTISLSSANNSKGTKEENVNYKTDADKTVATKKSLENENAAKPVASSYDKSNSTTETASGKVSSAPASVSINGNISSAAYYIGSELAIRNYVLSYVKEKKSTKSLAGTYKIKGNVSADGKLKVSSIIQSTKVNCNCDGIITEALNTMTKWNSAAEDGKKVSSNVEFIIAF